MSSPLALAGVTYLLRDLLNDGFLNNTLNTFVNVTARPPLHEPKAAAGDQGLLNIFLYQVTANAAWRNAALPSRDYSGERVSNPPLALDLHYLITAYDEREYHSEVLLGYAMTLLHDNPGLSRPQIRASLKDDITYPNLDPAALPETLRKLKATGLADQIESLKITPHYLTTDEMSKLWTGFQAPYRPSMAYQVSVVLIESEKPARTPLPVRARNLKAVPFAFPVLEEIAPLRATVGTRVILRGKKFIRPDALVFFGENSVPPLLVSESRIEVDVPPGSSAGIQPVRVSLPTRFDISTDPHGGFESNALAFLVVPVTRDPSGGPFTVQQGGSLSIEVTPPIQPAQRVELLVEKSPPLTLPVRESNSTPLSLVPFTIPANFPIGENRFRLRVDGADSDLVIDTEPLSATYQQYIGPILTVTSPPP